MTGKAKQSRCNNFLHSSRALQHRIVIVEEYVNLFRIHFPNPFNHTSKVSPMAKVSIQSKSAHYVAYRDVNNSDVKSASGNALTRCNHIYFYPFLPPRARPLIMYRAIGINNANTGRMLITAPAVSRPQST